MPPRAALVAAACAAPARAAVHADVAYKTVAGNPLLLDLWTPPDYPGKGGGGAAPGGPTPLLVYVYGGAWETGSKAMLAADMMGAIPEIARQGGYAVMGMNYRLTGDAAKWGGADAVYMPAQIDDVRDAVEYVVSRAAEFNVDPARVGVWGESAGAHLTALLAASSVEEGAPKVKLAATFFAPTDLLDIGPDRDPKYCCLMDHDAPSSPESKLLGSGATGLGLGDVRAGGPGNATTAATYARAVAANPITHATAGSPPMFLRHGTHDALVPPKQSQRLADRLSALGVERNFSLIDGANHAWLPAKLWRPHVDQAKEWTLARL